MFLIVVDRAYASFAVLVSFLKVVAVNIVANVIMVEFVGIKVAQRIESFNVCELKLVLLKLLIELNYVKLQNLFMMNLRSGRMIFFVM